MPAKCVAEFATLSHRRCKQQLTSRYFLKGDSGTLHRHQSECPIRFYFVEHSLVLSQWQSLVSMSSIPIIFRISNSPGTLLRIQRLLAEAETTNVDLPANGSLMSHMSSELIIWCSR